MPITASPVVAAGARDGHVGYVGHAEGTEHPYPMTMLNQAAREFAHGVLPRW